MSDEFVDPFDAPEGHVDAEEAPLPADGTPFETLVARASLVPASSLMDPGYEDEPAELGFEPDNRYLGFLILSEDKWPTNPRHQIWKQRFYVASETGVVGLVPWPGSRITWPWERGWHADLHRKTVTSHLKEPKETKKK